MEGGVHNIRRVIQANGDVLWTNKLIYNVPNYDKKNPMGSH